MNRCTDCGACFAYQGHAMRGRRPHSPDQEISESNPAGRCRTCDQFGPPTRPTAVRCCSFCRRMVEVRTAVTEPDAVDRYRCPACKRAGYGWSGWRGASKQTDPYNSRRGRVGRPKSRRASPAVDSSPVADFPPGSELVGGSVYRSRQARGALPVGAREFQGAPGLRGRVVSGFPTMPESIDDAQLRSAATAMVARAGSDGIAEGERRFWHELGCWLLDVVDHRRAEFDSIVGPDEEGRLVDEGVPADDDDEVS